MPTLSKEDRCKHNDGAYIECISNCVIGTTQKLHCLFYDPSSTYTPAIKKLGIISSVKNRTLTLRRDIYTLITAFVYTPKGTRGHILPTPRTTPSHKPSRHMFGKCSNALRALKKPSYNACMSDHSRRYFWSFYRNRYFLICDGHPRK